MAIILSGEILAKRVLANLKKKLLKSPSIRKRLCLAVVQVGGNPASLKYIAEKEKAAQDLGIGFRLMLYPKNVSQAVLGETIQNIGKDPGVSGMIVQLPLPKHINTQLVLDAIPQGKDVDVLSSASFAEFVFGTLPILPPTVAAISFLLKKAKKEPRTRAKHGAGLVQNRSKASGSGLEGARVAVVGAGRLVGLPVSLWLAQQGAVVSLIQKGTKHASQLIKQADIVISGVGKAGLIAGSMIKKGAVVIDAGTSVESGKTQGDIDFKSVSKKAGYLSPVPGGVGPLTVACLFSNLIALMETSKQWK